MALGKEAIRELYRARAGNYDITANLYYLIGFRAARYRKMAVAALALDPGATVVEIGCGTGLNFPYLMHAIGAGGRLIGVDMTDAMLEQAGARITRNGWKNVHLVPCEAAAYEFPPHIQGVISTFALTLVPEYEAVIEHAARALARGGRLVILDFKMPEHWPLWVVKLGVAITRPFGVTLDLAERRPWETLKQYFPSVTFTEIYGGFVYIAIGHNIGGQTRA